MNIFKRNPHNPILLPDKLIPWESYATFNGSIVKKDDKYVLLYRAMSDEQMYKGKKMRLSTIGKATSQDGVNFSNRSLFIKPENEWEIYGCEDPRVTYIDGAYYIFYTALSDFPPNYQTIKSAVAVSRDLETISEKHLVTTFNAKAMTLFPEKINGLYTVLLSVDTDKPPAKIAMAQFEKISTLWDQSFWDSWYENIDESTLNIRRVTTDQVEIGAPPLKTNDGWLLFHSYIKNYFSANKIFRIEALLLDLTDPKTIIGRIEEPCLQPEEKYEHEGQIKDVIFPEGALIENNEVKIYYGAADNYCCLATAPIDTVLSRFETNSPSPIKCKRFPNNPLLRPIAEHGWENKAVFNPAAIELKGKTYLIYRTQSTDNISYFGCAVSHDGIYIDERMPEPIYVPRGIFETSTKGGGYGCEDPRITMINDTLYMCYTAFDGQLPRLALTSITTADFLSRLWSKWTEPKIISPPGIMDKDGCLFPEKINGQYAFFHRIEPNIVIDFVEDLEFIKKPYLQNSITIHPRTKTWDDIKIGINAPPTKTEAGWLVFYHGISQIDYHYRLGALLLDIDDLSVVLARLSYPILEPETYSEKVGVVNNVVFPCGFVLKEDEIYLYYGGADKVVCGATINKKQLLDHLLKSMEKKYLVPLV